MTYEVEQIDHKRFTVRLNKAPIAGQLRVVPPRSQARGFRASGVSTCLRQTGYRLLRIPETDDRSNPDNSLAADQGTAIHVRIQEQLAGGDMLYHYPGGPAIEVDLRARATAAGAEQLDRWSLSGHVDAVIVQLDGSPAVLDIKTAKPDLLRPNAKYLPEKLQGYATQTHTYMAHLGDTGGNPVAPTYIYMISRGDTRDRALYRIAWQPDRWAVDAARLEAATIAVKLGSLPEPEPERGGCRWCPWLGRCQEGRSE